MTIGAGLAADLRILTAALAEPGVDLLASLHRLSDDAEAAVPTYLGMSVTVDNNDPPFTFTTLGNVAAQNVCTTLQLTLPSGGEERTMMSATFTLYAGTPGAFVDLTADLAWLTGRPPSDFVLDRHLSVTATSDAGESPTAASDINQAIGVLIGCGYTPEGAHGELAFKAAGAGTDRHTAARTILDNLTIANPTASEPADRDPNID